MFPFAPKCSFKSFDDCPSLFLSGQPFPSTNLWKASANFPWAAQVCTWIKALCSRAALRTVPGIKTALGELLIQKIRLPSSMPYHSITTWANRCHERTFNGQSIGNFGTQVSQLTWWLNFRFSWCSWTLASGHRSLNAEQLMQAVANFWMVPWHCAHSNQDSAVASCKAGGWVDSPCDKRKVVQQCKS